jgi:hypothetical protein
MDVTRNRSTYRRGQLDHTALGGAGVILFGALILEDTETVESQGARSNKEYERHYE